MFAVNARNQQQFAGLNAQAFFAFQPPSGISTVAIGDGFDVLKFVLKMLTKLCRQQQLQAAAENVQLVPPPWTPAEHGLDLFQLRVIGKTVLECILGCPVDLSPTAIAAMNSGGSGGSNSLNPKLEVAELTSLER